jgi:transposase
MAKNLFWLSDEAWQAIEQHLPNGRPGKPRVDDRTVISCILDVLKTGCRWRDLPSAYGPANHDLQSLSPLVAAPHLAKNFRKDGGG